MCNSCATLELNVCVYICLLLFVSSLLLGFLVVKYYFHLISKFCAGVVIYCFGGKSQILYGEKPPQEDVVLQ